MKFLYIANVRMPTEKAHGFQIMKMCEAFSKAGVQVELVVPRRFNSLRADPFSYYRVKKAFIIKKIPCIDLTGKVPFGFIIQTFTFLIGARLYALFQNYEWLYTREQFTGMFFNGILYEVHALPKKMGQWHRYIWTRTKLFIVLTDCMRKRLENTGIPAKKIIVAPDGVDLNEFAVSYLKNEARDKLNIPQARYIVGYAGMLRTMEMEKGIGIFLEAIPLLSERVLFLCVGGSQKDVDFYRKKAVDLQIEKKVIFTGLKERELIPVYLAACDSLVAPFPDIEHYRCNMSPLKIFEYMASRRIIVITDLPAVREILNETNAILIRPNDKQSLASGIKQIIAHPEQAQKIAEQALVDVKKYTWQKRAEKIMGTISAL